MNKFVTTREPSNPLNPVYRLSKVEYVKPEPLKFIRDQMKHDDIEGSRPKHKRKLETRESNKISDIEGTKRHEKRKRLLFSGYDNMNYDDVTKIGHPSNRVVNPLAPEYQVTDNMTGDFTRAHYGTANPTYGVISGQKPSELAREVKGQKGM